VLLDLYAFPTTDVLTEVITSLYLPGKGQAVWRKGDSF